jgi:hypothetical protein
MIRVAAATAALGLSACTALRAPAPAEADQASEVLGRFLAAAELDDFETAYCLLAGPWRAVYTPARLQEDFALEPLARERLQRARAALRQGPRLRGEGAEFAIGDGKAVRLVREGGAYRVASLE